MSIRGEAVEKKRERIEKKGIEKKEERKGNKKKRGRIKK